MNVKDVLCCREYGPCGKLLGNQLVIPVFVSTPRRSWNQAEIDDVFKQLYEARNQLYSCAMLYRINVIIEYAYFSFKVSVSHRTDGQWLTELLKCHFGRDSLSELSYYYAKDFGKDGCAFLFFFKSKARSFACNATSNHPYWVDERAEISVDFASNEGVAFTILHELLHLYGAVDLYYPTQVKEEAAKHYPNSVMYRYLGWEIDSLNAYLIGWTDTLDQTAQDFINVFDNVKSFSPPSVGI